MSTSGTVSAVTFKFYELMEEAGARAKIPPEMLTGEAVVRTMRLVNLALSDMINAGIQLWTREKVTYPLYEGTMMVDTGSGTSLILSANRRTLSRLSGTNATSDGGTVANAFDDDFDTILTQTGTNGNVSTVFDSATTVNVVGLLPGATGTRSYVVENSSNGSTWNTVLAIGSTAYVDDEWKWYDLDGVRARAYWRVRETGGGILSFRELYWGNNPSEVPLAPLNLDDYNAMPNKSFSGQVVQYYQDRRVDQPRLFTWPVCSASYKYDQLVCYRQRYIQDVTGMMQDVEVPQRWRTALVSVLAVKMCESFSEADKTLLPSLQGAKATDLALARGEERDPSPFIIRPDISMYT